MSDVRKRVLIGLGALLIICLTTLLAAIPWGNAKLKKYVESDAFRAEIEKQTAKGLHFAEGHYEPIKRTGAWTAESAGFNGKNGRKALRTIDARGISAKFDPWGVFRRLWYLDYVRISRGEVEVQVYEPHPEPSPPKPWYAKYILPERVYLNHVEADPANVVWQFRGKRAGIYDTQLLITPHGRDFNYHARGGTMRMDPLPKMQVKQIDMRITRQLLTLFDLDLQEGSTADATIHLEGKAGTAPDDRSVDFRFDVKRVPLSEWVPADWRTHVGGFASTEIHWTGKDTKLENSAGQADCRIDSGDIHGLPFLNKLADLANDRSFERIKLDTCRFQVKWQYPMVEMRQVVIEENGKFRAEGEIIARKESLRGTIELGVAPSLLKFLTAPVVEEVFPRSKDGYRWTTVHLSGTLEEPRLDLSERLIEALKEHPAAALKLLFRELGESLGGSRDRE